MALFNENDGPFSEVEAQEAKFYAKQLAGTVNEALLELFIEKKTLSSVSLYRKELKNKILQKENKELTGQEAHEEHRESSDEIPQKLFYKQIENLHKRLFEISRIESRQEAGILYTIKGNKSYYSLVKRIPSSRKIESYGGNYMPIAEYKWVGRKNEIEELQLFCQNDNENILSLIAFGGFGKSSLLNRWLENIKEDQSGAEGIFFWSFFLDRHMDSFLENALSYFCGDPHVFKDTKSSIARTNKLFLSFSENKNILILDGFEVVQKEEKGDRHGACEYYELELFLNKLASVQEAKSKCIVASRKKLPSLESYATARWMYLEERPLSLEDSCSLLKMYGVYGEEKVIEGIARAVGFHPLALVTIAGLIWKRFKGNAEACDHQIIGEIAGSGARDKINRIMAYYDSLLGNDELLLLRAISFTRSPITAEILYKVATGSFEDDPEDKDQFHYQPSLLPDLTWGQFMDMVVDLDKIRLIYYNDKSQEISMHQLIKKHFMDSEFPAPLKNDLLGKLTMIIYNELKKLPESIHEMKPLINAIYYGIASGRYYFAREKIWRDKVNHGEKYYLDHILGATELCLELALAFFPERDPSNQPFLPDPNSISWLLNEVALKYHQLGKYNESREPFLKSIKIARDDENFHRLASVTMNLCYSYIYEGEMELAETEIKKAISFLDQKANKMSAKDYAQAKRNCLACLAYIHSIKGSKETADIFAEALHYELEYHSLINKEGITTLIFRRGIFYADFLVDIGDIKHAQEALNENIKHIEINKVIAEIARYHRVQARIYRIQKNLGDAMSQIEMSLEKAREVGWPDLICEAFLEKARIEIEFNHLSAAQVSLEEVFSRNIKIYKAEALGLATKILIKKNSEKEAKAKFEEASLLAESMEYARLNAELKLIAAKMNWTY